MTLISLSGCPGWSESSLGAEPLRWFCHVAAHFYLCITCNLPKCLCSFPVWYNGQDVDLDCIDSWSLSFHLPYEQYTFSNIISLPLTIRRWVLRNPGRNISFLFLSCAHKLLTRFHNELLSCLNKINNLFERHNKSFKRVIILFKQGTY